MKKVLLVLGIVTISASIALSLGFTKPSSQEYTSICRVTNSSLVTDNVNQNETLYKTSIVNEDGEEWIIYSNDNLTDKWLEVFYNNKGTKNNTLDDEVTGYNILED